MPSHSSTNFEIQKYHQNEAKFNRNYSRNHLLKIKDETDVINVDEYESIGTHGIALCVNGNYIIYFDSLGVEHISKEIKRFIRKYNNKKS